MASIVYRRGGNKVYVYYYDARLGRTVQVGRDITEQWDGLTRAETADKVAVWLEANGLAVHRIKRVSLAAEDLLQQLWDTYQAQRESLRERRPVTKRAERRILTGFIVPYFIRKHHSKDPSRWHGLVPEFLDYLVSLKISARYVQKILWTLARFGDFLVFRRHMSLPFAVLAPSSPNSKHTPLKSRLAPEAVLAFATAYRPQDTEARLDLMALIGYFAALRPEELYALSKEDFLTGEQAEINSKTRPGFVTVGLGSRLSIIVNKSLDGSRVVPLVKTEESLGVVNIWNKDAARALGVLIRGLPPGRLFPGSRSKLDRHWRIKGKPALNVTVHDLRRASCLWLGRTARIPLTLLQEHARHAEIDTTMLYTREPAVPELKITSKQDFDEVV